MTWPPAREVGELLNMLVPSMRATLGDDALGAYVFGSAAIGGFDEGVSDCDVLVVTRDVIDDMQFKALDAVHERIVSELPGWWNRIEVLYAPAAYLAEFRSVRAMVGVVSPGDPFEMVECGVEWLINWFQAREFGVVLFGPPPAAFIPVISDREYGDEALRYLGEWVERIKGPLARRYEAYGVLTAARSLCTLAEGGHPSKHEGAVWACARYPDWAPLLRRSLAIRADWRNHGGVPPEPSPESVRFVMFAHEEALRMNRITARRSE